MIQDISVVYRVTWGLSVGGVWSPAHAQCKRVDSPLSKLIKWYFRYIFKYFLRLIDEYIVSLDPRPHPSLRPKEPKLMEPKPMGLSQESLSLWLLRKLQFRDISIYESLAIAFYEALLLILMNDLSKKSKKVEGLEKVI